MDKNTATDFVTRIEAHRETEAAIWQEMRERPDFGMNEDKTIAAILDARKRARDLMEEADSDLAAFEFARLAPSGFNRAY